MEFSIHLNFIVYEWNLLCMFNFPHWYNLVNEIVFMDELKILKMQLVKWMQWIAHMNFCNMMKLKLITYLPIRAQLTHLDQINDKNEPYQHGCIYIHEISQLDKITHGWKWNSWRKKVQYRLLCKFIMLKLGIHDLDILQLHLHFNHVVMFIIF
jgi:hypothetical protein